MSRPIVPKQVRDGNHIPGPVFDAFNELIVERWNGKDKSWFRRSDVVARIKSKMEISESEIFSKGYLDIESAYKAAGWEVFYDKPGHNDLDPAIFTFTALR